MQSSDIEKIVKYIRNNIESDITLDDIAEHMNYSKFHLSRSFKKAKGTTIKRYIEAIKIEKSIEKIIDDEESVTDIAYDVSHKSPGTFSNTFKKQTAISPKKYMKESSSAYKFLKKWIHEQNVLVHYANYSKTQNSFSIRVKYPDGYDPKITCIGLFAEAMPKGEPVVGVASSDILELTIENIPNGEYYLFICEIMEDFSFTKNYVLDNNYREAIYKPFSFKGDTHYKREINMRRPIDGDPPININIPAILMRTFAKRLKFTIRKKFY